MVSMWKQANNTISNNFASGNGRGIYLTGPNAPII